MTKVRVGFVGLGNQANENLLPALSNIANARIAAVCDQQPERVSAFADSLGDVSTYLTVADMIRERKIDAIIMACPPDIHAHGARLALEAGLPVFVEKPPCVDTATLLELADLAARKGITTGVGLNFRFASPIQRVRSILMTPRFGGVAHLELRHLASKPRASMWGLHSLVRSFLLAQTIHAFDLAVSLGGILVDIDVQIDEVSRGGLIIRVQLRFTNGTTATVLTGSAFPAFEFGLTAVGRNHGLITLDNLWTLTVRDEVGGAFRPGEKRWSESWVPGPLESGHGRAGYLGELEAFISAVTAGTSFEADFAALIPTYEIIDWACTAPVRLQRSTDHESQHDRGRVYA